MFIGLVIIMSMKNRKLFVCYQYFNCFDFISQVFFQSFFVIILIITFLTTLCHKEKKVFVAANWPAHSGSWKHKKQPYVGGFSRSPLECDFSSPPFGRFCFVKYAILGLLGHGIEVQMTFFQNFSSSPFSRNETENEKNKI